jgi:hypothetical protein
MAAGNWEGILTTAPKPEPSREANPFQAPEYRYAPRPQNGLGTPAKVGIVLAVLVALVMGGLGAVGCYLVFDVTALPKVGDCLHITRAGLDGGYEKLSCRDSKAAFRVEAEPPSTSACPSGDYTRFRVFDTKNTRVTLCLVLNVTTGECLSSVDDETRIVKTRCGSVQAQTSVSVKAGVTDENSCASADVSFVYDGPPPRTVCLHPVGESI